MLRFRGREITHKELGFKLIERIEERLATVGKPEGQIKSLGMTISVTISPK